ncbi:MAG: phosphatase PAP2 family protein [Spartobacteria bacterium]
MKPTPFLPLIAVSLLALLPAQAEQGWPMPPASYFIQRIPPPPKEGDAVDISDLDYVLAVQACATKEQIKHSKRTADLEPFKIFSEVLGRNFTASRYPLAGELFEKLSTTGEKIKDQLKAHYARKRPVDAHEKDGVVSYVPRFASFSYPSGHSLRGWLWALVLAELDPAKKKQIIYCGARVGSDRVVAGVHYQTDIMASRALGRLIFEKLKDDPDFMKELAAVKKAEWSGAKTAPATGGAR